MNSLAIAQQRAGGSEAVGSEAVGSRSDTATTQAPRRTVYLSGDIRLDSRNWPIVGHPDAEFIFAHMYDYTCPHCRAMHAGAIRGAQQYFGKSLAVMMLSTPMASACNDAIAVDDPIHAGACELSRVAVAVWRVDPKAFPRMHDWLMINQCTPREAFAFGSTLVGEDELRAELKEPNSAKYVARQVELYKKIGAGAVPKILFPETTLTGEVDSVQTLCEAVQSETVRNRPQKQVLPDNNR